MGIRETRNGQTRQGMQHSFVLAKVVAWCKCSQNSATKLLFPAGIGSSRQDFTGKLWALWMVQALLDL